MDLAQFFTLNSFRHHVVSLFLRKEKVLEGLIDIVTNSVLQNNARELCDQFVNKRLRGILNKKVVGVPSRKLDVKAQRQRPRHENLILVQLRRGNL